MSSVAVPSRSLIREYANGPTALTLTSRPLENLPMSAPIKVLTLRRQYREPSRVPSVLPARLHLSRSLVMRNSLTVYATDEDQDGVWVASAPGMSVFGEGPSVGEAVFDFADMLVETYRDLQLHETILGRSMRHELRVLRAYIEEIVDVPR